MRTAPRVRRAGSCLRVVALALAVVVSGRFSPQADAASHGVVDPSFDGDGKVTLDFTLFSASTDWGRAGVAQPDGKIVVAGERGFGSADFAVARFNSDGSLDLSFGNVGWVALTFGGVEGALAVDLQVDGKIVVAGYTDTGAGTGPNNFALARFNANGSVDTSFGSAGKLALDLGDDDRASAVKVMRDGRIVVVGLSGTRMAAVRLTSAGALDSSFDNDGRYTLAASFVAVSAAAVDQDGRLLIAGGRVGDMFVLRLLPSGDIDTDFGIDGYVTADFGGTDTPTALLVQADGKIVVAGAGTASGFARCIARFTNEGALDGGFGAGGKVVVPSAGSEQHVPRAAALLFNGKIALGGHVDGDFEITVLRSNGSVDASFDGDGTLRVDFGGIDEAMAIAVQPAGGLVLAGHSNAGGNYDFAVLRVGADTGVDTTFDTDGRQAVQFGSATAAARGVVVQPDGKVVATFRGSFDSFALARFNVDGAPDLTFGVAGSIAFAFGGSEGAWAIARQPDGRFVLVGSTDRNKDGSAGVTNVAALRATASGSLDTTFNDIAAPSASNGDGRAVVEMIGAEVAVAFAVAIQADGKIVVACEPGPTIPGLVVLRFNANGTLDSGFGTAGVATISPRMELVRAILVQPDGRIVVAGAMQVSGANDFSIVRLMPNGTLDTSFNDVASPTPENGDGRIAIDFFGSDVAMSLALQADGKIVVGGQSSASGFGIARLTSAGRLDPLFDGDGRAVVAFGRTPGGGDLLHAVAVQANGKILVAGYTSAGQGLGAYDFAVARLLADGTLDASYANGGKHIIDLGADDLASAIAIDPVTGKAVIAGATGTRMAVVRLAADPGGAPSLPSLSISDASVREGHADTAALTFSVTLSAPSNLPVTAVLSTANGSASSPADYGSLVETPLLFQSGVTQLSFVVPVVGDLVDELDETLTAAVSLVGGATVADGSGLGTILDDEVAIAIQSPTTAPSFTSSQPLVSIGGTATDMGGLQSVRWTSSSGGSGAATGTTDWVASVPVTAGANVVTVTATGAHGYTATDTVTINVSSFISYLAEGATSTFLTTRLALLNPGAVNTTATVTFAPVGSANVQHVVPMPAHTRVTVDPKTVPGLATAEFSTKVESGQPVVVDRTMSWDATAYGAHAETAVAAPSTTWYLAEGATHSGFDLFYLLQNPSNSPTTVRVRYLRPSGAPLEKDYTLPPESRTNIWVNVEDFPGQGRALAATDVSAVFESLDATPIIVERALYLTSQGRLFNAGHESAGVTAPSMQWFLAEGATGPYFDLFVLIANPNASDAVVRVTYLLTDGQTFTRTLTAPANSRTNIWVDAESFDGGASHPLANVAASTTVTSENGVPIIVERALWWPGDFATWHEAHNSAGATQAGTVWAVAEGEVASAGSARGDETYILIANTSPYAGNATVTLFGEDGATTSLGYALPANSRTNVAVGPDFGTFALGRRFGAVVESTGSTPAQIVVERAMYWNAGGVAWAAGTNALATRLR